MEKDVVLRVIAFILLLISISLISLFINTRDFSKTGFEGFLGAGFQQEKTQDVAHLSTYTRLNYDQRIVIGSGSYTGGAEVSGSSGLGGSTGGLMRGGGISNLNELFNPPNVPLFFVEGLDNYTNYLRLYTSSTYRDGKWIPDKLNCGITLAPGKRSYRVTPIVNLTDYLPVAKDTGMIIPDISECFDSDKGVYAVKSTKRSYTGFSSADRIEPNVITEKWSRLGDEEIRTLAEKITRNATTDYERVKAIEDYLKENYINGYTEPVAGKDPVKYFLFESKRGTCREFASAFVLLARSLEIPARVVFGYLADPTPANQTIYAADAYVWAEVKFDNGWVEFDPTPGGELIETEIGITYVNEKIIAGKEFRVRGYVRDTKQNPVSGLVEIYLKRNKESEDGILAGILFSKNGVFEGNLTVPNTTGEYSVVAHYTGSFIYNESWSDPRVRIYEEPKFIVNLPSRIPTQFLLVGELRSVEPYTGKISLCIDHRCTPIEVIDSVFKSFVELPEGNHSITLRFDGKNFTLPATYTREVEVCRLQILANETVREGGVLRGKVMFCDEPYNGSIVINNAKTNISNGSFSIDSEETNLTLGRNLVQIRIPEFGYREYTEIYMKRHVTIDFRIEERKLAVYVRDSYGLPVDGYVEFNGVKKALNRGYAEFELPDEFKRGFIRYTGSEKYFSAEREVEVGLSFPLLLIILFAIPVSLAAYHLHRRYGGYGRDDIRIEFVKEHPELPNVWEAGEIIRFRVESEHAKVKLNGKFLKEVRGGGEFEIKFDTYGKRKIIVEIGKLRKKRKEVEIKISPYSDGIIEVFNLLVDEARKRGINVKNLTAREILRNLNLNGDSKLLQLFELSKYGGGSFNREDFLNAFHEYLKLMERI